MAKDSSVSRRELLRQQQEQEERRQRNRRLITSVLAGVLVLAIVAGCVMLYLHFNRPPAPAEGQLRPPNATEQGGIRSVSRDKQPEGDVPHLIAYEDFQCPGCAGVEQLHGESFEKLVDEGKITMEYRIAVFMDRLDPVKQSSTKAAIGAAAADAVGKFREYHRTVFAHQPEREGDGYTDEQLREEFPKLAGIEGDDLKKFQEEFDARAYADFVQEADRDFSKSGLGSTPAITVNGKQIDHTRIKPTLEDLEAAIMEAAESN